jgi:predicted ATPase
VKSVRRIDSVKVDTTPPWPFPKREVVLRSSEWPAIWKKIRDRTTRDLERDNAQAQDAIKEALDQRDALQTRVDKMDETVKKVLTSLGVHTQLATDLIEELKSI